MRPIDLVSKFIATMNDNDIEAAMNMLSEDVFYHNVPRDPVRGRAAALGVCRQYGIGERLRPDWEVLNIAESNETVLTERIDRFVTREGRTASVRLMGAFRVRNDEIIEWRDYYDSIEAHREFSGIQEAVA